MARHALSNSWLDRIAKALKSRTQRRKKPLHRRLGAELLEGRMVLSVAPLEAGGESLAEYLTREQEMGPMVPAEFSASYDQESPSANANDSANLEMPEGEDCDELPEGCGEGGGEGSGSGEGTSTITGTLGLEGLEGELSCSVDGALGSFSIDDQGNYVFEMENPEDGTVVTITVTDSEGNSTSTSFTYHA